ncbi:hypothetical protein [Burkholderia ubonensis]|uniref:hypothetical protein n=1 Tax=Burkholderia ubonensis TaxID=101571 RepID=UPI00075B862C|nr:hypothetical protein [Burkholderia ubonensis]KWN79803.1 hypothetical protein WM23_22410 [Burkholderia ubonensis]
MLTIANTGGSSPVSPTETIEATDARQRMQNPCEAWGISAPRMANDVARPTLSDVVERASESRDKAKALGVDTAKRQFVVQALALAAASIGLGAAIAATVLSAGAGTPLLALAGLGFALASADTACALYEWRSKAAGGDGLPMAGDSMGNMIHAAGKSCHASNAQAQKIAAYASMGLRSALSLGALFTAFFVPAPSVGAAVSTLSALVRPTLAEVGTASGKGIAFNHARQQQKLDTDRDEQAERTAAERGDVIERSHQLIESLERELAVMKTRVEILAMPSNSPYPGYV